MALTLAQGAQMAADPGYLGRVRASMLRTAYTVRNETQGSLSTNAWVKRRAFAVKVLNSPDAYASAFLASLAADGGLSLTWYPPVSITSSTNANPSVITTSAVHGLVVGDVVEIQGHLVNTNINGVWTLATVGSTTTFTVPFAANGVGGATGTTMKQETDVTVNFTINNIFSAMVDLNPVSD
jgi:hypothetical protein